MAYYGVKGFLLDKDHICESVRLLGFSPGWNISGLVILLDELS